MDDLMRPAPSMFSWRGMTRGSREYETAPDAGAKITARGPYRRRRPGCAKKPRLITFEAFCRDKRTTSSSNYKNVSQYVPHTYVFSLPYPPAALPFP